MILMKCFLFRVYCLGFTPSLIYKDNFNMVVIVVAVFLHLFIEVFTSIFTTILYLLLLYPFSGAQNTCLRGGVYLFWVVGKPFLDLSAII